MNAVTKYMWLISWIDENVMMGYNACAEDCAGSKKVILLSSKMILNYALTNGVASVDILTAVPQTIYVRRP